MKYFFIEEPLPLLLQLMDFFYIIPKGSAL